MSQKRKCACYILLAIGVIVAILLYLFHIDIAVLEPKGWIALKQRNLFVIATVLMLIIVVPVLLLAAYILWKYRTNNGKARYSPEWDNNHLLEIVCWGFPFVIVLALGIINWFSCHELDPFKPIESGTKPIRIQVVALDWKWLFIYPDYNIASVNYVQFPERTPLNFEITSDAPMNSFWIPELGGQIYAMTGMRSKLHLIADKTGSFYGSSANLSGTGFAGMKFIAKATSEADFLSWVQSVNLSSNRLNLESYQELFKPSSYNPVTTYVLQTNDLFDHIIMKYMMPMPKAHDQ